VTVVDWTQLDPLASIGGISGDVSTDVSAGGLSQAGIYATAAPYSPDHPLFWFAALAGVTFGLIGLATHVRVGPFKAGFQAGKEQ
jgi:hypothetical protein